MNSLVIFSLLALSVLLSLPALAASTGLGGNLQTVGQAASYVTTNVSASLTIAQLVGTVVGAVIGFSGVVFVTLTVYAGLLWMMAGGNDEKVNKSKTLLRNAVVGLFIT